MSIVIVSLSILPFLTTQSFAVAYTDVWLPLVAKRRNVKSKVAVDFSAKRNEGFCLFF